MLVLIAESKTMAPCDRVVAPEVYAAHTPLFSEEADAVMESLRGFSPDQLAAAVKISVPMARKLQQMIYEFPNRLTGCEAIEAFTGVVFKSFAYPSLPPEEKERTARVVRIISSLYGWLRPDDVVKPYRFDFTTPLASGGKTFAAYWRGKVTATLISALREGSHTALLNLLPGDAARCIDWKELPEDINVFRADFREVLPGGAVRTPNAGRLKMLRGRLLRQIVREGIDSGEGLLSLEGEGYVSDNAPCADGSILFHSLPD